MNKSNGLNLEKQEKTMLGAIAHLSLDELMELQAHLITMLDLTNKRISFLKLLKKMRGD